ncbi:MAG: NfeD family protein [Bacteroidales bacterium]|jgi:membrane-bound ClpP family serine protease|nr:NfeD family protein [Bacteroidales bacterium]MDD2570048.1 NfeD family protein [Bacteroidales bacterium]MDD2812230.1 NfeD family protein [Bacteroidales bacterium]MDD3385260.1 NfeD family protein [Bacteroidales bacterium]MDD3811100.1 NfeD family protein [Bacteroidales bacterium]
MSLLGIFLIILAGLLLFLLEILVIPGITIAGIGALILMGLAVYLAFSAFGVLTGLIVLLVVLFLIIILIIIAFRARTWKRVSLSTEIGSKVEDANDHGLKPGDEGITLTRLAPVGTVQFGEERIEGHSEGPFIDHKVEVVIVRIASTYVIVKPKKS